MSRKRRSATWVAVVAMVAVMIGVVACGSSPDPAASPTASEASTATESASESPTAKPTGALDGAALVQERCTKCHTLDRVKAKSESRANWAMIVDQMIANGASLNNQEKQAVIDYLAATYPD